jgi:hypothetical protein
MDALQNLPPTTPTIAVSTGMTVNEDIVIKTLEPRHMMWIDYCALGGMMTDDQGNITNMTITVFADKLSVSRTTLNNWKKAIPGFWDLVRKRRIELSKNSRASKVYNGLFLKASLGDPAAVRLWAELFDNYQPPAQKHDVKVSGLLDLVNMARKNGVIEGEVVNGN